MELYVTHILKTEARESSETLEPLYHNTRPHITSVRSRIPELHEKDNRAL